ncbi:MAG: hypothetical protein JO126_05995 [Alphaproteobacteria bacterium]|nr:hypothetical protein [Alphaproteobacteria bacterium]MBV8548989.1 hypothetical protein [Alphaproteobacteria bacterium]
MRFGLTISALLPLAALVALAACTQGNVAQFWRPISEPNIQLPLDKAQRKLNFDISQCHCGIYPTSTPRDEGVEFQEDKQRLAETGLTVATDKDNQCVQQPSLIVSECMRQRGWEETHCSGRMPLAGGGSLCSAYLPPSE